MRRKEVVSYKKAQFSMEYLLMMGFTLMLLLPTIVLFLTESGNIQYDISSSQATQIARKIADKAEEMYYQGEPSRTTLKVNMPGNVVDITFSNKEITVQLKTPDNNYQNISQIAPVNMTGSIDTRPGIHYIEIRSEGDYISISET